MELIDAIYARRMTRDFSSAPIGAELLDQLLVAALRAPSAGFAQGVELLVLADEASRRRFWDLIGDEAWRADDRRSGGIRNAPAIIVPVGDPATYVARYREADKATSSLGGTPARSWPVEYWNVDAAFATMILLLAATDAGLGALFFQLHGREKTLLSGFDVPDGHTTIGAVALGRPAGSPKTTFSPRPSRPRREPSSLVHRDRW